MAPSEPSPGAPRGPSGGRDGGPGALVLVRHGQSTFNADDRFTGLLDVPLSDVGVAEAGRAARLLADAVAREPALAPRRVVTSPLVRASTTAAIVADALPGPPPLAVEWRLVERHYGAFTDKPRDVVRRDYGEAAYWRYRRSYLHRPPPLAGDDPARALVDDTLLRLPDAARAALRPDAESLADVVERLRPFWAATRARVAHGEAVLVVGHGNSLRALSVLVDDLTPEEVQDLDVPTGHPLVHRFTAGPDDALVPEVRGGTYLDAHGAEHALGDLRSRGGA